MNYDGINDANDELRKLSDRKKAKLLSKFFKTGKGEYGEGDKFIGVTVPNIRKVAKHSLELDLEDVLRLLHSKIHEERLLALLILVEKSKKANIPTKHKIFKSYLDNTKYINNWDLVDLSAGKIIGSYLLSKNKDLLYSLARSRSLWERRIAIISTFAFIKNKELIPTFRIAKLLLKDEHDLINKAVGWMLREAGKISRVQLEVFLKDNYSDISRTTLRYSIERFPETLRKKYLKGSF